MNGPASEMLSPFKSTISRWLLVAIPLMVSTTGRRDSLSIPGFADVPFFFSPGEFSAVDGLVDASVRRHAFYEAVAGLFRVYSRWRSLDMRRGLDETPAYGPRRC